MKKYIFFCMGFHGISGGPSYINNKSRWLESNGWNVYGFSGYMYGCGPILYDGLKELKKSLIAEFTFHAEWFNTNHKIKVVNTIKKIIDYHPNDEIVIESNSIILSEWGEIISASLNAKHIVYLIAENLKIHDERTFDFLNYKYKKNELFTISPNSFEYLFVDFLSVKDANNHFWDAMASNAAEPFVTKIFDNLPSHDWVITHFGRFKDYFPNVLSGIDAFAHQHRDKKILFVIVGNNYNKKEVTSHFRDYDNNVKVLFFDPMVPIPQRLFDISDVVVSTAGCACISYKAGAKTISMDVERNEPLGVLGYTTKEHSFRNGEKSSISSIEELLSEILIEKKYSETPPPIGLALESREYGYDYHLSFTKDNEKEYYSGKYCTNAVGKQESIDKIIVKKIRLKWLAVLIHIIKHYKKEFYIG